MMSCNICRRPFVEPLYVGPPAFSITSLCEIRTGQTSVYFCDECGHLQTTPLPELHNYYNSQYRILLDSDDEDQLYQIRDGQKVYRIEHQVQTFLRKIPLARGARVLDFGCAKGASAKRLSQIRPDVAACLFDVSEMYLPFWERFAQSTQWCTHEIRPAWERSFDAVMAFYVLEHVVDPVGVLKQMARLLKSSGVLHWLVPNVFANSADFIVADHVNHFSERSICAAVVQAGLEVLEIDSESHEAGWIVLAAPGDSTSQIEPPEDMTSLRDLHSVLKEQAEYWSSFERRIREFEDERCECGSAAIYGSGFYGTFIASRLAHPERIQCFVDQSVFRQGKRLLEKPIVAPEQLALDVETVYVGLNKRTARQAIAEVKSWRDRRLTYFFL